MTSKELIELKFEMEFGSLPSGRTLHACAGKEPPPRLLVSRHADGYLVYVRDDLPADVRDELLACDPATLFCDDGLARRILARHAPAGRVWRVHWHVFDRAPVPSAYRDVTIEDGQFVSRVDGEIAARAWTTQSCARAAEVEVETAIPFRRRGHARQVVASWAAATLAAGHIAYYSHLVENQASAALARSLGLCPLSDEIEYA